jgi:ATP-dependent DNA ligase
MKSMGYDRKIADGFAPEKLRVTPRVTPVLFIPSCIPTRAAKPPAGAGWVHEIKHDGYRLQVRREGDSVRLFTRRGYDWSEHYPAIARTPAQLAPGSSRSTARPWCAGLTAATLDELHPRLRHPN